MKSCSSIRYVARSLLALVAAGGLLGACGGPIVISDANTSDGSDTTTPSDVLDVADATADASDAALDANDAGADIALDAIDGGSDVVDASDVTDAGETVSFMAMVHVSSIFQNCQPEIAMDPLQIAGTVDMANIGTASIGPITSMTGAILTDSGMAVATFGIAPIDIAAIAPGSTGSTMFTKTSGTLAPAMACDTVACNSTVRVAVDISGPNIPPGTRAISAISRVDCVF